MNLSAIRAQLAQLAVTPAKTLGQNFLHDGNLARWLVAQVEPQPGERLVEIGPGLGALTEHTLARGAQLTAIEKDGRLAAHLRERFQKETATGQLAVVHGDATLFDVRALWPDGPVTVLGNLPYYVTTPLLFHFCGPAAPTERALLVMQRELAARLAATPAQAGDYGILSLVIQRRWRVQFLRTLPASVFTPTPKVASGAVWLTPRAPGELPPCDGETFEQLVRRGFSQRRKQVGKLLAVLLPDGDWPAAATRLGVSEKARAEELDLARWIALANLVRPVEPAAAQDGAREIFDVVDAANAVVGQASRAEVHARGLRHRALHIFVFNAAGELFLQRRSPWKDTHPDKWDSSAAGHLDAGESYAAAARRELREELGLDAARAAATELREVAELGPARPETGWEFIRLFVAQCDGPFRPPPEEIAWGGFFPLAIVERWIRQRPGDFAPGFLECWKRWRAL
ncbi:MAG: ribosomal RNA small subunit methyltransferase A [Verrucomicrobia bacterium]|nr:ribosomal RNA small subunit methyltransferase A [Verrucomicrobiota bacterium]